MDRILVPVDFSQSSANAMLYALDLAKKTDAKICVFHVLMPTQGIETAAYDALWLDDYMALRKKALNQWVLGYKMQPKYANLEIWSEVKMGFPVFLICSKSEDEDFDLIVMGSKGATGLLGAMLGSVAAGVIARSKVPIASIPKKSRLKKNSNVVMATDFRFRFPDRTFMIVQDLLRIQNSRLKIVHVQTKGGGKADKEAELKLSERLASFPHDYHYLKDADVVRAVGNFIESTDASALIVVHHDRGIIHKLFIQSVSENLAKELDVPVYILQDTY